MPEPVEVARRTRLSEGKDQPLEPFVRATAITAASVYWMPVSHFPIGFRQRQWILELLMRLSNYFTKQGLLEETLLQLKYTRQELNRRFTQTLLEYEPVTGVLVEPGRGMPAAPTSLDIKKLVDNPNSNAEIDIQHLVPDYVAWFLQKKAAAQRQDFLGVGGMMLLWVKPDAKASPEKLPISKALRTHPAFAGHDLDAQLLKLHSMQAPWLKESKQVFGGGLQDEAMFQGVPFVLPRLQASDLTSATPDTLQRWLQVFPALCVESERDRGLLFAVADPEFDEPLRELLQTMRDETGEYPL